MSQAARTKHPVSHGTRERRSCFNENYPCSPQNGRASEASSGFLVNVADEMQAMHRCMRPDPVARSSPDVDESHLLFGTRCSIPF